MTKWFSKPCWGLLATGLLVLAIVPGVLAQTPPEKRLDELERQVQSLQQTVEALRRDLKPAEAQQRTSNNAAVAKATSHTTSEAARSNTPSSGTIARIRDEGLKHSQVMQTLSYLTDVIGPRLTGSPALKRANQWTSDKLASWGLSNAHLEAWGPFGRGWSLKRFSAQIIEPQAIPLLAYPEAWSPGFEQPIAAEVVRFEPQTEADLAKYKGKLRGAIVLLGPVREVQPHFDAQARRWVEADLLRLANAGPSVPRRRPGQRPPHWSSERSSGTASHAWIWTPGSAPLMSPQRTLSFLAAEKAAVLVEPSPWGDQGAVFVAAASVPEPPRPSAREKKSSWTESLWEAFVSGMVPPRARAEMNPPLPAWSKDAPDMPAQIALADENYGRLVRMIQQGEKLKMAVELQVQFHNDDQMAYNTIAEIPGSDLKDEIVMLGAHIDSWHAGTGATDNAAGVAAAMEAVRIITALKLRPRRTIRIALWSGEEQGLLGSRAYVKRHFGEYTDPNLAKPPKEQSKAAVTPSFKDQGANGPANQAATADPRSRRKLVCQPEYEKLSVYFNLDNGAGKIRGVYLQGNEGERPIFRSWLEPFRDLGADTISLADNRGTDHQSFDAIGLPAFQFIQDPIDYFSRTHHSNADVFEHILADDLKQAATILAAFTYNAAMIDERLPRNSARQ